jgi:hypothetical protein
VRSERLDMVLSLCCRDQQGVDRRPGPSALVPLASQVVINVLGRDLDSQGARSNISPSLQIT